MKHNKPLLDDSFVDNALAPLEQEVDELPHAGYLDDESDVIALEDFSEEDIWSFS